MKLSCADILKRALAALLVACSMISTVAMAADDGHTFPAGMQDQGVEGDTEYVTPGEDAHTHFGMITRSLYPIDFDKYNFIVRIWEGTDQGKPIFAGTPQEYGQLSAEQQRKYRKFVTNADVLLYLNGSGVAQTNDPLASAYGIYGFNVKALNSFAIVVNKAGYVQSSSQGRMNGGDLVFDVYLFKESDSDLAFNIIEVEEKLGYFPVDSRKRPLSFELKIKENGVWRLATASERSQVTWDISPSRNIAGFEKYTLLQLLNMENMTGFYQDGNANRAQSKVFWPSASGVINVRATYKGIYDECVVIIPGDIDASHSITGADKTLIQNITLNTDRWKAIENNAQWSTYPYAFKLADMDNNAVVNGNDGNTVSTIMLGNAPDYGKIPY